MERYILADFPVRVTDDAVIERLKLADEDDIDLVRGLLAKAREVARAKAIYKVCYVDSIEGDSVTVDGSVFTSARLARNLAGIHRVFPFVVTCGTELDEWAAQETDYIVSVWLDVIKEMIMGDARTQFARRLEQKYGIEKLSSMGPGSGNIDTWPLREQVPLFELIGDVKGAVGVELTNSLLMVPSKTVSGMLFPSEAGYVNCAVCRRDNCVGRRAAYDPALG